MRSPSPVPAELTLVLTDRFGLPAVHVPTESFLEFHDWLGDRLQTGPFGSKPLPAPDIEFEPVPESVGGRSVAPTGVLKRTDRFD